MNREDVIRMANEAEMEANEAPKAVKALGHSVPLLWLERFAALLGAAERRKHQADIEHWKAQAAQAEKWRALALCKDPMQPGKVVQEIQREAMELERESCAQTAERMARLTAAGMDMEIQDACAAAIRARGNQ